jgi:hypothetical protein
MIDGQPRRLDAIRASSYQRTQNRIKPRKRNLLTGLTKSDPSAKGSSVQKMKEGPCDTPDGGGGRMTKAALPMHPKTEP